MSTEEQRAAIGRIVENYQQCKVRLTALTSEAGKRAATLGGVAARLSPQNQSAHPYGGGSESNPYSDEKGIDVLLDRYPSQDEVRTLLSELHAVYGEKIELRRQLKDLGLADP